MSNERFIPVKEKGLIKTIPIDRPLFTNKPLIETGPNPKTNAIVKNVLMFFEVPAHEKRISPTEVAKPEMKEKKTLRGAMISLATGVAFGGVAAAATLNWFGVEAITMMASFGGVNLVKYLKLREKTRAEVTANFLGTFAATGIILYLSLGMSLAGVFALGVPIAVAITIARSVLRSTKKKKDPPVA